MHQLFLKTSDNIKIALNHFKSNNSAVLIIAPGWFMTKDSNAFFQMSKILSEFVDIIAFDFRGHGKSGGFYTFGTNELKDIETVVNYAKQNYKHVSLAGFSLGASMALIYAAKDGDINKVIAVSAPSDFLKIENHMYKKEAWLWTFKKFELKRMLSIRPSFIIREKIKPIDIADKISAPTLFIAGEKDPTVYPWHSEALYQRAKCKKHYELFLNCAHAEDLFLAQGEKFISLIKHWLEN